MTAHYSSKHGIVSRIPEDLYMAFCDMRNFSRLAPEQLQQADISADFDSLSITVQGFKVCVRVDERRPYNLIRISSAESPIEFVAVLHFERYGAGGKTDFWIELDANINFMMKSILGSKVQKALDKMVDSLVGVSEGRTPDMNL